jgi:hypothetical protein
MSNEEINLKANELVERFKPYSHGHDEDLELANAKQCALIAVDEILTNKSLIKTSWDIEYWNKLKQAIENL